MANFVADPAVCKRRERSVEVRPRARDRERMRAPPIVIATGPRAAIVSASAVAASARRSGLGAPPSRTAPPPIRPSLTSSRRDSRAASSSRRNSSALAALRSFGSIRLVQPFLLGSSWQIREIRPARRRPARSDQSRARDRLDDPGRARQRRAGTPAVEPVVAVAHAAGMAVLDQGMGRVRIGKAQRPAQRLVVRGSAGEEAPTRSA